MLSTTQTERWSSIERRSERNVELASNLHCIDADIRQGMDDGRDKEAHFLADRELISHRRQWTRHRLASWRS